MKVVITFQLICHLPFDSLELKLLYLEFLPYARQFNVAIRARSLLCRE